MKLSTVERIFVEYLCDRLGIPTSNELQVDIGFFHVCWDGARLRLGNTDVCDALHDIAHWLVAHPDRRAFADFGLKTWVPEESLASALGIALHAVFDIKGAQSHAVLHNWLRPRYGRWGCYSWCEYRGGPFSKLRNNKKRVSHALAVLDAAGIVLPLEVDLRTATKPS
jgi:hypothetical protein